MARQDGGSEPTLEPVLAHFFGAALGGRLADLAGAKQGEHVLVLRPPVDPDKSKQVTPALTTDEPGTYVLFGDSEDDVPDPLPIIDFLTWEGPDAARSVLEAGWDVLIGMPPVGLKDRHAFEAFLQLLQDTSRATSRALLLLPAGPLQRKRSPEREAIVAAGHVKNLVVDAAPQGAHRRIGVSPHFKMSIVHLASLGNPHEGRSRVHQGVDSTNSFQTDLPMGTIWSYAALDPKREQELAKWAKKSDACELGEILEQPQTQREIPDDATILHPRQITDNGIDHTVEVDPPRESRRQGLHVSLQPGDIVGRSIGEPNWSLVTESDIEGGLLVSKNHALILRTAGVDPRFVLAFLHSDAAKGQMELLAGDGGMTIERVTLGTVRALRIPGFTVDDESLGESEPVAGLRALADQLVDDIRSEYTSAFDEPDAASTNAGLRQSRQDAAMAERLLARINDPLARAQEHLPHPLARVLRVLENHREVGQQADVYQDLLRFGETAIILLGAIGLAHTRDHTDGPGVEWRQKLERGGIALGDWLDCANAAARIARESGEELGGVAKALSTKSKLNQALGTFLAERNDHAHGAGPRTPFEYQQQVLQLDDALHSAAEGLAPLARADWFVVEQLAWDGTNRRFHLTGRSLQGDHPDFSSWTGTRSEPLESTFVHVRLGNFDLALKGFCILKACAVCLHEELYYPDRIRGGNVRLRSLDRGHQSQMPVEDFELSYPLA